MATPTLNDTVTELADAAGWNKDKAASTLAAAGQRMITDMREAARRQADRTAAKITGTSRRGGGRRRAAAPGGDAK